MAVQIWETDTGARLSEAELRAIARAVDACGRVTLLVPSFETRDRLRAQLAGAHVGTGVDVTTPSAWISSLWELFGDGRAIASALERQLVMAATVDAMPADQLAPLRNAPGTVRMLSRMARDLLGFAAAADAPAPAGGAGLTVRRLLASYREALDARGRIELCEVADIVAHAFAERVPACARAVVLRDIVTLPAYLQRLLAVIAREAGSERDHGVSVLLARHQESLSDGLARAFAREGCAVERGRLDGGDDGDTAVLAPGSNDATLTFLEVSGPHAKAAAYADEAVRLLTAADEHAPEGEAGGEVLIVSPRPAELFDKVAPRLAACGVAASVNRFIRWGETIVGQQFRALSDLAERMEACGDDRSRAGEWWPAPELTDWLYSPLSGIEPSFARAFDKKMRANRNMTPELVMRELQSVQSRQASARKKLDVSHPYAAVPAVCSDVFSYICQARPVSALKAMLSVAEVLPASAFGSADGQVRMQAERSMAQKAIQTVGEVAHALDVSQAVAVTALDGLCVAVPMRSTPSDAASSAEDEAVEGAAEVPPADSPRSSVAAVDAVPLSPAGSVRFLTLVDAAALEPHPARAVLFSDVDADGYPLSHEEGPLATLAAELKASTLSLEPAARLRDLFARVRVAAPCAATLARVTHDRQAKDRYPAAIWTELRAQAPGSEALRTVGEGDIVRDFDPAGGAGMRRERVACLPPQELSPEAVPYVVLKQRDPSDPTGTLIPRRFSASQIESYLTCPLCWFMSSRIRPQTIDAGFTNMEKGNFVHDLMERFHAELIESGERRVTPENREACIALLRRLFDEMREEHARGKTSTSAPLVPLSTLERVQIDEILPQLEAVVNYEAEALPPFAPSLLEYSFDGLGVTYAGRPLGGRIDRVDTDAEGRAVVIDYKHRSGVDQFKLKDPTVPDAKTGDVPADDPDWLPEHTQSLIYAQALKRAGLGMDARAALYFSTKSMRPAMRGAVADELLDMVPGLKDGFPAIDGGSMDFDQLLDRVEETVGRRLDEMEAGVIQAADRTKTSCTFNHALGFERRDA